MSPGVNHAFDGPDSKAWIDPFAGFLLERSALVKTDLDRALRLWPTLDTRLGWLAVTRHCMSASDVYSVLALSQDRDARFGELAVELGVLSARQVAELLEIQHSPFRLFVHCLLTCRMLEEAELCDQLEAFVETQGLPPVAGPRSLTTADLGLAQQERHVCKEWVWRKLEELGPVAMIPEASAALLERLENSCAQDQMHALVEADPALATQLLRIARSATTTRGPLSVERALEALGPATVRQLVLMPTALCPFAPAIASKAREVWLHAQRCAAWSELLASQLEGIEDAWIHGLLHDLGRWVLLQAFPAESLVVERLASEDASLEQAERQVFGTTHADIGAYVCREWSLPESVGQAALHHSTPLVLLRELGDLRPTTRVVHAACRLAHASASGDSLDQLDPAFIEFHGLTNTPLAEFAERVEAHLSED